LPVICGYVVFTLRRDLADFQAYSPRFNEDGLMMFEQKTEAARELVNPKGETSDLKVVTARMYAMADGLIPVINRVEGYVKLAKGLIPVSPSDFGFPLLRKKIASKDMEGLLQNLQLVIANMRKYLEELASVGLTEGTIEELVSVDASIAADNELQYEILTQRIELVKANVNVLNALYGQLMEICEIGKILYKQVAPEKALEYTFTYLLKKVCHIAPHLPEAK